MLASGEAAGAQKRDLGQTFPSKKNPCGSNSDQRDYLEIGLTTSRTASLGPEIRSAEPWLLLPITQDDSSMLTTYEVTNLIFIYIEGSFDKVFLSRTKDSKSKKAKPKMVIF